MAATHHTQDSKASIGAGLLFGAGATALGVFAASRPLVGVAVYVAAAVGALALRYGTDAERSPPGDTRDASAADATVSLLGIASAVGFPALVAADGLGYFTWTEITAGVALGVAGVFVVYGAVSVWWSEGRQ